MDLHLTNTLNSNHLKRLKELLNETYWGKDFTYSEVFTMVDNSGAVFAYTDKNNDLVAFARVLTDFVFKGLILDVVVAKEYQGRGVGSKLINEIMTDPKLKKVRSLELYCKNEVIPFYDKFGFKKVKEDMYLLEKTSTDLSL